MDRLVMIMVEECSVVATIGADQEPRADGAVLAW